MIEIGKYQVLEVLRETSVGLFLGDDTGEDVLLPLKYCPEDCEIGDFLNVFVYLDGKERKVATNIKPKVTLHTVGFLEVFDVSNVGAFVDWGLEKHLLVPFKEQQQRMEPGKSYLVYLDLDKETDRLYGSTRLDRFIKNDRLTVKEGDEVDLIIRRKTDLGYAVVINNKHRGLLYDNEIFQTIAVGDTMEGYVKTIREDNKIDVTLSPQGFRNANDKHAEAILLALKKSNGTLMVSDKSSPEMIYSMFGMSKKAFKKALGGLYKSRTILIQKDRIILTKKR